jgi:mono/diheme cytochrome c family protein
VARIVLFVLFLPWLALPLRVEANDISFAQIARGKYLVAAGDCMDCHTPDKAKPFAGGGPVETPFGTIYSSNITPDKATGIGAWSDDEFYRAMHFGIARDGSHLYPAFPYPYFTRLTRDDVSSIRAYLGSLDPIRNTPPANKLMWPLNHRFLMSGWNQLYFNPGDFRPDARKSAEWNRGAYLVEGPGHCGACHTSKNLFGADKDKSGYFQGAQLQNWFAPKLVNDNAGGIGAWSIDDIVQYLKTGRNAKSGATGLMAEVVQYSTSQLNDGDLRAIATYLKDLPGNRNAPAPTHPDETVMAAGKAIYEDSCGACHKASGDGVPYMFPPLKANANVQSRDPTTIVRVLLNGARTQPTAEEPTPSAMPAYDWKLSNDEIAAVATYIRNAWGNVGSTVTADDVQALRDALQKQSTAASAGP